VYVGKGRYKVRKGSCVLRRKERRPSCKVKGVFTLERDVLKVPCSY